MKKYPVIRSATLLLGLLSAAAAHSYQISPNPNPVGNTLTVAVPDVATNTGLFDNSGGIVNNGLLTNTNLGSVLTNLSESSFLNTGSYINQAQSVTGFFPALTKITGGYTDINNVFHPGAVFTNGVSGSIDNQFTPGAFAKIELNGGTLDNYGAIRTNGYETFNVTYGAGIMNFGGALNNQAGAVMGGPSPNFTADTGIWLWNGGTLNNTGTIHVGELTNNHILNNQSGGLIRIGGFSGEPVYASLTNTSPGFPYAATINNDGTIQVGNGGALVHEYLFNNNVGGVIQVQQGGALYTSGAGLTSQGAIQNSGGSVYLTGLGGGIVGAGSYTQTGATAYTSIGPTQFLQASSVDIQEGTLAGSGSVGAGTLTIGAAATILPGSSPGSMSVNGDLALNGTYLAEIAGSDPGGFGFHDVLFVSGTADLGFSSVLAIHFDGSFTPTVGDVFNLLTAEVITGTMGSVLFTFEPPPPPPGEGEGLLSGSILGANGYTFSLATLVDAEGTTDWLQLQVLSGPSSVPLPPAAWLFAAGIASLAGTARRRRRGHEASA